MAKKKYGASPVKKLIYTGAQILVAIGTPPLFFLKIFGGALLGVVRWLVVLGRGAWWAMVTVYRLARAGAVEVGPVIKKGKEGLNRVLKRGKVVSSGLVREARRERIRLLEYGKRGEQGLPVTQRNILLVIFGLGLSIPLVVLPYWVKTQLELLPDPKLLAIREIPVSTKIFDRNGVLLYQIYSDENRSLVALDRLPKHVVEATIAIEDKNFYRHPGFDVAGIARAVFANSLGATQGGSTITQQLVRSALLTPQRTIGRKVKELVLAFWAERVYSKKQILSMYLNQVPYGGAAYGIEEAAKTYFRKAAADLTLAEAALLAGLPSAPSVYSPFGSHPELAKERQRQTLQAMVTQGYISPSQEQAAEKEVLKFATLETSIKAPHFVMYVKDYLTEKYGVRRVERGGLEVVTSLDYLLYEEVSKLVREGVARQKHLLVGNGAALVTNPKTGEILSMVGSTDFFDLSNDGNVNVTIANRSPGSAIKPLNYALALERGIITPATIVDDSIVTYQIAGQPPYTPGNYDGKFHGKVSARVALASSYNVAAVKVLEKVGVNQFLDWARKMGVATFVDDSRYGLSVTLGGGEVKMTDIAVAFGVFANQGARVNLKSVFSVKDYRGNVLEDNREVRDRTANTGRVVSPQTAFLISSILSDDVARAPAFGAGSMLAVAGHTVAVKTGTAETKRDNWTIGYSFGQDPRLVAVWVGNNNNTPMSPFLESGNTGAAAIWNPTMAYLLKDKADSPIPTVVDIVAVSICTLTGTLTCDNCPTTKIEYFKKGQEPKAACKISQEELEKLREEKDKKDKKDERD